MKYTLMVYMTTMKDTTIMSAEIESRASASIRKVKRPVAVATSTMRTERKGLQ